MGNVLSCLPWLSTGGGTESSGTDPDMPGLVDAPAGTPFSVEWGCTMSVLDEDILEQQLNWIQIMELMQFMGQPEHLVQVEHYQGAVEPGAMEQVEQPERLDVMEQHQRLELD